MMPKLKSRKGQFFIIFTSVLLFMIISIVLIKFNYTSPGSSTEQTHYMFENTQSDMERVVNIILSMNRTSQQFETTMHEYYSFLSNYSNNHGLDLRSYYFIGLPDNNHLNITVGNFYGSSLTDINISLTDPASSTTTNNISILTDENETTLAFDNAFDTYNTMEVSINFTDLDELIEFNTTRSSVFEVFYLELGRDNNTWIQKTVN